MKTHTLIIFAAGFGLTFGPYAFPQGTPCPPGVNPSGKTTQSKGAHTQAPSNKNAPGKNAPTQHQAGGKGYHGSGRGGGVGFGVGATIDLGGIGQRRAEPNPFAVQAGPQPVATRTVEKPPPTKKPREVTKTDPFANVQLTGEQAKEEN
jgi:hypothetical protein